MRNTETRTAGRFVWFYLLLSLLFAAATLALWWGAQHWIGRLSTGTADADSDTDTVQLPCIILDPGHGGEDGGAVGVDGLLEKTVNLQLAKLLYDQLTLAGIPVIMTRTDDRLLYDPTADYRGHKKMLDLRARLDIVRDTPDAVLLSIHQNAFSQAKYSGLQVYYSPHHPDSARLADLLQSSTRQWLQSDNTRKTKPADSSIYLLDRSDRPAVLVECGFLSNPDECAKLGDAAYLGQLSTVLFVAVCEYLAEADAGA